MKSIKLLFGIGLLTAMVFWLVPAVMSGTTQILERQFYVSSELGLQEIPAPEQDLDRNPTVDENGEPIPGAELPFPEGELPLIFEDDGLSGEDSTVDQVEGQPFIAI